VWHQGEENSGQPVDYECFQPAMIRDWQQTFAAYGGAVHIPFIFVQVSHNIIGFLPVRHTVCNITMWCILQGGLRSSSLVAFHLQ
jgi:hypothetical protein